MRIAILGANGQIGRLLFTGFEKQFPGAEILACVRRRHLHFEGVAGNHLQRSIIFDPLEDDWNALGKVDVIINCIGAIDTTNGSYERVHLLPVRRMLENRQQLGDPRIIQISALGAATNSPSAFLRTKAVAEELILQCADSYVIRPSIVCTPGTMLVRALQRMQKISSFFGGRIPFPAAFLHTKIQPVLPADLLSLICKIIVSGNDVRRIDVAGPEQISLSRLFGLAGIRPVPISQKFSDLLWKFIRIFPLHLLNDEQYQLLHSDNVTAQNEMEKIICGAPESTIPFWKREFSLSGTELMKRKQNVFN